MKSLLKRLVNKNKVNMYMIYLIYLFCNTALAVLFFLLRVFPIKNNKIVCCNMHGKRYGDNPKYIIDEILSAGKCFDIVWLMKKDTMIDLPDGVRCVKYNSIAMIYELATAKVWIDSNTKLPGVKKRKGQYYIQTWHGSYGIKKIGKDLGKKLSIIDRTACICNAKMQDLMLSNSVLCTAIFRRAFWYKGEIMQYGSPRNDVFFRDNKECIIHVQDYFGIRDKKIALYAPTYRNDLGIEEFRMDFYRLKESLEKRFGGEWVVLIRLHPNNIEQAKKFIAYNESILNASDYNAMQELLVTSSVLISDYSSCMLDFITVKKPCFIYATDIKQYKEEQDFYFELNSLPFPIAQNNNELEKNILEFDEILYKEKVDELFKRVSLTETGKASIKAAQRVIDVIERGNR